MNAFNDSKRLLFMTLRHRQRVSTLQGKSGIYPHRFTRFSSLSNTFIGKLSSALDEMSLRSATVRRRFR